MGELGQLDRIAAAVTEGDADNIALLQKYGVRYVETPNQPLGRKHNAALELAGDAPRYMVLPSDDLISAEWVSVFDSTTHDYVSPDRCALVDLPTMRAKLLTNKPNGRRKFGAGRIFSRAVVNALGGAVWTDDKASGLDTDSHGRIVAAGFSSVVHQCERVPITDLKTPENLWGFDVWTGDHISVEDALHMFTQSNPLWRR